VSHGEEAVGEGARQGAVRRRREGGREVSGR